MGSGRMLAMLALDGIGAIDLVILIGFFVFFTAAGAIESLGPIRGRSPRDVEADERVPAETREQVIGRPAAAPASDRAPAPSPVPPKIKTAPAWPVVFAARLSSGRARIGRLLRAGARSTSGGFQGGARAAAGWAVTAAPVAARAFVVNLGMPEDVVDEPVPRAESTRTRGRHSADPEGVARPARRAS